jgi:Polyketide cyclase / dehydrase and lipid transport
MASNDYWFVNRFKVEGTAEEVCDLISHPEDYRRWWPANWLRYEEVEPGAPNGLGRVFRYRIKGWLPYTLNLTFRVTDVDAPHRLSVVADGDLVGTGTWTFEQDGPNVIVTYEWRVRAAPWYIRRFSRLFKPVFRSNHFWSMRMGAKSLRLELARRHARSDEERARIPRPPRPLFPHTFRAR